MTVTGLIPKWQTSPLTSDPDKHNGMIIHLDPDILECEVKWALGSISMNKASGGDQIPAISNPKR